jgi:hypothetical protein
MRRAPRNEAGLHSGGSGSVRIRRNRQQSEAAPAIAGRKSATQFSYTRISQTGPLVSLRQYLVLIIT